MIRISTFLIMDGFGRRVHEFLDDKLIVRVKSLSVEAEYEIEYRKIRAIQTRKQADLRWLWAAFVPIAIVGIMNIVLRLPYQDNSALQLIEKAVIICGLVLCIPAFHKHELCSFLDAHRVAQATILVNNTNRQTLREAIALVKRKAEITSETYLVNPLTGVHPNFEVVQYDFPDFLNRSVARFYTDRIVESENSLVEELVTEIKYGELSGKTRIIKVGDESWGNVWCFWVLFIGSAIVSMDVFFPQQMRPDLPYLYVWMGGAFLLVPMFFLRYMKKEYLMFCNDDDQVVYWTGRSSANRKQLDQIVEFIQIKISSENLESVVETQ